MQILSRREFLYLSSAAAIASVSACELTGHNKEPDERFPRGQFGADATADAVAEGMDLSGKTALVTGCNSGLGYETMCVLASRGAHVIGTGRTLEKAEKACASVAGNTTPVVLELSDFPSAVDCAETVKALDVPLDILIANAGMSGLRELKVIDGIEQTFRVNYLGHFVLVNNLCDWRTRMLKLDFAPNSRASRTMWLLQLLRVGRGYPGPDSANDCFFNSGHSKRVPQ